MKIKRNQLCFLLVTVGLILSLAACGPAPTPAPTATPYPTQPDEATFREYFSEIGLGLMPPGTTSPGGLQQNVSIFAPGDQFCQYGTIIKEVQPLLVYYDTEAKEVVGQFGYPPMQPIGFLTCAPLDLPAGKYELKVYVGDILVAVVPFEVR